MSPDTKALVDAIDGLRQSGSILKTYVLPFVQTIFATCIGFFIAWFNFRKQEAIKSDSQKVNEVNKFIVLIDGALKSLVTFKNIYLNSIDGNPSQRAVIANNSNVEFAVISGVENLLFLAKGNSEYIGRPYYVTWNNIPRINDMVSNYRYVVKSIERRNKILKEFELIISDDGKRESVFSYDKLTPEGVKIFKRLVNETEGMLSLVDGLILEMNSFLLGITSAISKSIDIKNIAHLVTLVTYSSENDLLTKMLQPIEPPDYKFLSELFDITEDEALQKFSCGYF